jgi:DNA-binding MarR family transcriptional regulator
MSSADTPAPAAGQAAQDAAAELLELFRRLRARLRAVSVEGGDLTPTQAGVLMRLNKDGASSTTVLAAAEGVRSQSMTATLNALDAAGLIERSADPEDGRRQIITLSRSGREQAQLDRYGRYAWLIRAMDERYTPAQLDTITEALALLARVTEE